MIDIAKIKVKAGDGGDGMVSFRRERYEPKGGPDGGDGGDGGNVYFVVDKNMATLMDFRAKKIYDGVDGKPGGKHRKTGVSGEDLFIKVPIGTLVYEVDAKETLVADMSNDKQDFLVAKAGFGGKGNYRFRSSTNQTPTQFTEGTKGQEKEIKLEVKLIADVGLVGAPNAGKSTLLNKLTRSNAKVASYPFTTLSPNLGVWLLKNGRDVILADIPGLIEGASAGKGLGDEFLRHIERTRLIVHMIDAFGYEEEDKNNDEQLNYSKNAIKQYKMIREELETYGQGLENKLEIVVINKIDLTEVKDNFESIKEEFKKELGIDVFGLSAVTGEGIGELENFLIEILEKAPEKSTFEVAETVKLYTIDNIPNKRMVFDDRVRDRRLGYLNKSL